MSGSNYTTQLITISGHLIRKKCVAHQYTELLTMKLELSHSVQHRDKCIHSINWVYLGYDVYYQLNICYQ